LETEFQEDDVATDKEWQDVGLSGGGNEVQLVTFKLDDQEYGLSIENVVEVVRMVAITRIPRAPDVMEGIINLRGRVVPVINLRKRFGARPRPRDLDTRLLVARIGGRVIALIVDTVSEVLKLDAESLDASDAVATGVTQYLSAIGKMGDRLLLIVDLDAILSFDEESRLEDLMRDLEARAGTGVLETAQPQLA
jgi:purine-binding chemotaxis protein CheW